MKNALLFIVLAFPYILFSQDQEVKVFNEQNPEIRPVYIGISMGASSSSFRDFATSPLFYRGNPSYLSIFRLRKNKQRESGVGGNYSFGNYKVNFNEHTSTSKVKTFGVYYLQLYRLDKWSSERLNVKIGGMFDMTGNFRNNSGLQNNRIGLEFIPVVFGSLKAERDISRTKAKQKKLIFINYQLKPRERQLSYQFNLGLINSSYRNGYAYIGQSAVLNKTKLFDGYEFKMFSGFRLSSALNYTIKLRNANAVQLSYLWNAYKTGGDLDKLEMAFHTLRFTFLFNTK